MKKDKVYETAQKESLKYKNLVIYVWENDFGEWFYGAELPYQYSSIIARFIDGEDILE